MKIPYMKEILLVCIGLNISFFFSSLALDNSPGVMLSLASGAMCAFGLWFNGRASDDD